jgi:hypothetical protein
MNLRDRAVWIVHKLDDVLLGSLVQLVRANRKVLDRVDRDELDGYQDDARLEHSLAALQGAREAAVVRLQRIEDKAKGTVIGVGIGVTVIGSASAFLGKDSPVTGGADGLKVLLALLLGGSIVFLLISGYLALRAYEIGRVWLPSLYDSPPLVSETEAKKAELQNIEQNFRIGTVRGNYLSASFYCLRNGLALLALVALVFLALSCTADSSGATAQQTSVREIQVYCARWHGNCR